MPAAASRYEPRDPTQSVLFRVVRDHVETFRAQAASLGDGEGLARFVEREFREFLTYGCLAAGFARFQCGACGHDRLVPFSCKGRGLRLGIRVGRSSPAPPSKIGRRPDDSSRRPIRRSPAFIRAVEGGRRADR